jgi:hypothetical protein
MGNDDNDKHIVQEKLILLSAENIISRIQKEFEKTFGHSAHREYVLEKFEPLAQNLNIHINEEEHNRLLLMRIQMYDNEAKKIINDASKVSVPKPQKPISNVVDIRSKIKSPKP